MTATAVFFLVLSAVVIWGGLLTSIARLRYDGRHEARDGVDDMPADGPEDAPQGGPVGG
jgi:hypothetical protein